MTKNQTIVFFFTLGFVNLLGFTLTQSLWNLAPAILCLLIAGVESKK